MSQKNREKYLKRTGFVPDFLLPKPYDFYVVIPVRREKELFPETMNSLLEAANQYGIGKVAYIIVINASEDDDELVLQENEFVESFCKAIDNVFVIDRFREKILKDGVGEARRIGMDHVVSFSTHNPWILSLDADTIVDSNYFSAISKINDRVVLIPFSHRDRNQAVDQYEGWLNYFKEGLAYANSPYAYVPLGCRFGLRLDTYVEAGGMVKRSAGEDFHFLQKLTKIVMPTPFGKAATMVYPSGRVSDRVPWGTGPALNEIHKQTKNYQKVEPAAAFEQVKRLLESVEDLYDGVVELPDEIGTFLESENYNSVLKKIRENSKTSYQFSRQFHLWFDGIRTIRFINHYTRIFGKEDIEKARAVFSIIYD